MISHDPVITDSLSSATCKSALLKLFGFTVTADSHPGSLCVVSAETWEEERQTKEEKNVPFRLSVHLEFFCS